MPKAAMTHCKLQALPLKCNIEPTIQSTVAVRREVGDGTNGRGPHGGDMRERRHQLWNAQS
jgi:hypothetical protein